MNGEIAAAGVEQDGALDATIDGTDRGTRLGVTQPGDSAFASGAFTGSP